MPCLRVDWGPIPALNQELSSRDLGPQETERLPRSTKEFDLSTVLAQNIEAEMLPHEKSIKRSHREEDSSQLTPFNYPGWES